MSPQESWWPGSMAGGWISPVLRVFGVLLPPLFLLLYPWPMAGGEILVAFGGMAVVSGALLRTWWAGLIVPVLTLSVIVGYALIVRGDVTPADDEFTTGGALLIAGVVLYLMALAALLGVLVGRRILPDGDEI